MAKIPFQVDGRMRDLKYRQIVDGVIAAIEAGKLRRGAVLPSVNDLCDEFSLARETVMKAYRHLKRKGIIEAVPRKGFFVATEDVNRRVRVFLLLDELSPYKQTLYNGFLKELDGRAAVDVFFHHGNGELFRKMLFDAQGRYDSYIIMPFPISTTLDAIKATPPQRLLLLDRGDAIEKSCNYLCQRFARAVEQCLRQGEPLLAKYTRMVLAFPQPSGHPREIITSFEKFCRKRRMKHAVVNAIEPDMVQAGSAYFVIDDEHMVTIVEACRARGLALGAQVGLLSYNDTPMKRVVGDGITVISTDFAAMGQRAAQFVLHPRETRDVVPTSLIIRGSL